MFGAEHVHSREALEPFLYLSEIHPGKNLRGILCDAINEFVQCRREELDIVKEFIKELHSASLIVDDIEDASERRRGVACSHLQYGIPRALNAANYAYFVAMQTLSKLPNREETMNAFCSEMLNLHRGQGLDILWRDTLIRENSVSYSLPTEEEYLSMVRDKTGGLFRLVVLILGITSNASLELQNTLLALCNILAEAFQVRDDLMSLCSPTLQESKGICEDLSEGKLSFITLHGLRSSPRSKELQFVLCMRTKDPNLLLNAVRILSDSGSFLYAGKRCGEIMSQARRLVSELGGSMKLEELFQRMERDVRECMTVADKRLNQHWLVAAHQCIIDRTSVLDETEGEHKTGELD